MKKRKCQKLIKWKSVCDKEEEEEEEEEESVTVYWLHKEFSFWKPIIKKSSIPQMAAEHKTHSFKSFSC